MNTFKKTQLYITLILVPFLFACGRQVDESLNSGNMPAFPTKRSYAGMSVGEVLHAKYQEAVLNCELRAQKGAHIDLKSDPQDTLSFDLLSGNLQPQTFALEGSADKKHSFTILLTLEDILILGSAHSPSGEQPQLQDSPMIELSYHYQDKLTDQKLVTTTSTGEGSSKAYENNMDTVLTLEYQPDREAPGAGVYFIDLRCLLKTTLKL